MAKLLNALLLLEVAVIITQWTTLTSIPSFYLGGSAPFGDTVFAAVGTFAYTLDTLTGIWTTVSSRPVTSGKAGVGALSGQRFIVAGGFPGLAAVHVCDVPTGAWTVKANLPIGVDGSAAGCDGQRFWVAGGWAPGYRSELQEYDSDADVWTSKTSLPLTTSYVSGAYWAGTFIVSRNTWIHVYTVAQDSWTTGASLPINRASLYGGVASIAGFGFVVGGNPTSGNTQKLERYDIGNDVWTTLDPVPQPSYAAVTAITSAGLLVAIGDYPEDTYVHGFTTGFSASPAGVSGDPLFHTFTGPPVHLSLGTAVFNFLTTPTVVVNALVEEFPSLPPEENTLITTLAVVSQVRECLFLFYCTVVNEEHLCSWNTPCEGAVDSGIVTPLGHGFRLSVGGLSLEVQILTSRMYFTHAAKEVNATFINVWVHPPPPHLVRPTVFGGIIGDMCSLGLPRVMDHLVAGAYTVASGCLFATDVKATAGMFSQQAAIMASGEC